MGDRNFREGVGNSSAYAKHEFNKHFNPRSEPIDGPCLCCVAEKGGGWGVEEFLFSYDFKVGLE